MKVYTRKVYQYSRESKKTLEISYTQPPMLYRKARIFNTIYETLYFSPIHWLIENVFDAFARGFHRAQCNNDCVQGQMRQDDDTWVTQSICGYMPLCARLDLKHYDLDHAKNTIVSERIVEEVDF